MWNSVRSSVTQNSCSMKLLPLCFDTSMLMTFRRLLRMPPSLSLSAGAELGGKPGVEVGHAEGIVSPNWPVSTWGSDRAGGSFWGKLCMGFFAHTDATVTLT